MSGKITSGGAPKKLPTSDGLVDEKGSSDASTPAHRPSPSEVSFKLLPLVFVGSQNGNVTSLLSHREQMYVGTSTGLLLRYCTRKTSALRRLEQTTEQDLGKAATSSLPGATLPMEHIIFSVSLEAEENISIHHASDKVKAQARAGKIKISNLALSIDVMQAVLDINCLLVLCGGVVGLYTLDQMQFVQVVPPDGCTPRAKGSVVGAGKVDSFAASLSPRGTVLSLCLAVGRRLFCLNRPVSRLGARVNGGAGGGLANDGQEWRLTRELVIPETAVSMRYVSLQQLCIGFKKEYIIVDTTSGHVSDVGSPNGATPLVQPMHYPPSNSGRWQQIGSAGVDNLIALHSAHRPVLFLSLGRDCLFLRRAAEQKHAKRRSLSEQPQKERATNLSSDSVPASAIAVRRAQSAQPPGTDAPLAARAFSSFAALFHRNGGGGSNSHANEASQTEQKEDTGRQYSRGAVNVGSTGQNTTTASFSAAQQQEHAVGSLGTNRERDATVVIPEWNEETGVHRDSLKHSQARKMRASVGHKDGDPFAADGTASLADEFTVSLPSVPVHAPSASTGQLYLPPYVRLEPAGVLRLPSTSKPVAMALVWDVDLNVVPVPRIDASSSSSSSSHALDMELALQEEELANIQEAVNGTSGRTSATSVSLSDALHSSRQHIEEYTSGGPTPPPGPPPATAKPLPPDVAAKLIRRQERKRARLLAAYKRKRQELRASALAMSTANPRNSNSVRNIPASASSASAGMPGKRGSQIQHAGTSEAAWSGAETTTRRSKASGSGPSSPAGSEDAAVSAAIATADVQTELLPHMYGRRIVLSQEEAWGEVEMPAAASSKVLDSVGQQEDEKKKEKVEERSAIELAVHWRRGGFLMLRFAKQLSIFSFPYDVPTRAELRSLKLLQTIPLKGSGIMCPGQGANVMIAFRGHVFFLQPVPMRQQVLDQEWIVEVEAQLDSLLDTIKLLKSYREASADAKIDFSTQQQMEQEETEELQQFARSHLLECLESGLHPLGQMVTQFAQYFKEEYDLSLTHKLESMHVLQLGIKTDTERFHAATTDVKEFVQRLVVTVLSLWPPLNSNSVLSEVVTECVDQVVFDRVYDVLFPMFVTQNKAQDSDFASICERYQHKTSLSDFGSSLLQGFAPDKVPQNAFADQIQNMLQLQHLRTPLSKLRHMAQMHKDVVIAAEALWAQNHTKQIAMSADELLPVLCFVMVKAKLPMPSAELQFSLDFIDSGMLLGALGYICTSLQIAVRHILCMDDNQHLSVAAGSQAPITRGAANKKSAAMPPDRDNAANVGSISVSFQGVTALMEASAAMHQFASGEEEEEEDNQPEEQPGKQDALVGEVNGETSVD